MVTTPNPSPPYVNDVQTSPLAPSTLEGCATFSIHGQEQQSLPLVVVSPHSGRFYPPSMVTESRLSTQDLMQSEDALVDQLVAPVAWQGGVLIQAEVARAYVDLNRDASELDASMFQELASTTDTWRSPRVAAGLGVIPRLVTQNTPIYDRPLPASEIDRRIGRVYHPFHAALAELVDQTVARFGRCLVIDCHSMPPLPGVKLVGSHPATARLQTSGGLDIVLGDRMGQSCQPWLSEHMNELFSGTGLVVERNRPFAGGNITQRFAQSQGLSTAIQSLQVEISRKLYLTLPDDAQTSRQPNPQFYMVRQILCDSIIALAQRFANSCGTESPFADDLPLAAE